MTDKKPDPEPGNGFFSQNKKKGYRIDPPLFFKVIP
jgi:hypothetical protein